MSELTFPTVQPVLETTRLILRPFTLADAPALQREAGDADVANTTCNIPHPYPDGAATEFIAAQTLTYALGEEAGFAIVLRTEDRLIGAAGLRITRRFLRAELGYWIAKSCWGRGYATEAARAVVEFGFHTLGLHKIEAQYFTRNPASGRVMQKIGMTEEGVLRDHVHRDGRFEDVATCGLIKS
jgi:RimJ/RimL family protein N-acetyltransferase